MWAATLKLAARAGAKVSVLNLNSLSADVRLSLPALWLGPGKKAVGNTLCRDRVPPEACACGTSAAPAP